MISIVLVNWNNWPDTIACVQSILNSTSAYPFRVIVVDNKSDDDSREMFYSWACHKFDLLPTHNGMDCLSTAGATKPRYMIFGHYIEMDGGFYGFDNTGGGAKEECAGIYVVDAGRNGGFGYGCNVGMRLGHALGSSAYWLLNNDCVIQPDTLSIIEKQIKERPRTIFGTVLKYYFKPEVVQAIGGGYFNKYTGSVKTITTHDMNSPINFINGASLILSDSCFYDLGGFDESIFMYFEENDLCIRAAKAGYDFEVISTDVFHKHGGSQGLVPSINAWAQVLMNKHYVLHKNFGWGPWIVFFYATLILRAVLPIGQINARFGARRALAQLVIGNKKT